MFDLKRPCVNCPFRRGQGELFQLSRERLEGIINASAFQCHKTLEYDDDSMTPQPGDNPQQCAGLMALLHRVGKPNQIMQIATRLGALNPEELDEFDEAYRNLEEAFAAHAGHPIDPGPNRRPRRHRIVPRSGDEGAPGEDRTGGSPGDTVEG